MSTTTKQLNPHPPLLFCLMQLEVLLASVLGFAYTVHKTHAKPDSGTIGVIGGQGSGMVSSIF